MSESRVFESRTRPGTWFWLAPNGQHGWTNTETEAHHLANQHTGREAA
jgi:hypothetical protein